VELTVNPNNGNQLNLKKTFINFAILVWWFSDREITHFSFKTDQKKPRKKWKGNKRDGSHSWKSLQAFVQSSHLTMVEKVSIMRSINQQGVPALGE